MRNRRVVVQTKDRILIDSKKKDLELIELETFLQEYMESATQAEIKEVIIPHFKKFGLDLERKYARRLWFLTALEEG